MSSLAKALAANDKATRDKAVTAVECFLAGSKAPSPSLTEEEEKLALTEEWSDETSLDERFADLELAKLWKAIFYCYWMSDKPLIQQELAHTLANLALVVRPKAEKSQAARTKAALHFVAAFWTCLLREWTGIDRLRIDKYLNLARRYSETSLQLLQREMWRKEAIASYNQSLLSGPLNVKNHKVPLAIPMHLSEIFLSTFSSLTADPPQSPAMPLTTLIRPYIDTLISCDATRKPLSKSIENEILRPFLEAAFREKIGRRKRRKIASEEGIISEAAQILEDHEICDENGEKIDDETFGTQLRQLIFDTASHQDTPETCRRRLYELCRSYEDL